MYRAVETDADPWYGHMHEVRVVVLVAGIVVLLETLDELVEHLLGHLAAAALQVGEARQPKTALQIVREGVEGSP